jgi:adenylate kinase family enzyme
MDENRFPGPRIVVVGTTGSGKTTTARDLARIFDIPHVELDALHWQPNWVPMETPDFRQKVTEALSGPAWVADGNYSKVRDVLWSRATTLVWLDYPLPVILVQLTQRTWKRVTSQQELWNGNRETWRGAIFSKDSLFLWALQSYSRQRRLYAQYHTKPEGAHLQMIRLRSREETTAWLVQIEAHLAAKRNR